MLLENIIAICGIGAAVFLGLTIRENAMTMTDENAGLTGYAALDSKLRYGLSLVALALGLSGFVALPLGYTAIRDFLIILHTATGGLLLLAFVPLLVIKAGGMGSTALEAGDKLPKIEDRSVYTFWIMVILALLLFATAGGILSKAVSQAGQHLLKQVHIGSAFLFLICLGIFSRQMLKKN